MRPSWLGLGRLTSRWRTVGVLLCFGVQTVFAIGAPRALESAQYTSIESQLQDALMKNYSSNARPIKDPNSTITVQMGLAAVSLQKLDQTTGEADFNVYLRYWWTDEYLRWNPDDWGNVPAHPRQPRRQP